MTTDTPWMTLSRSFLGTKEIPGRKHNNVIVGWLQKLRAWWSDDETPWCGVFVAYILQTCGFPIIKHWYRARAWAEYGTACSPGYGAILVFGRKGGGHVGFYVGENRDFFLVRGGNQNNRVSNDWIAKNRLIACRQIPGVKYQGATMILAGGPSAKKKSISMA